MMIKLETAQQHQKKIKELQDDLNAAVAHATMEGLHIEMEFQEVSTIGARNHPIITATVTVNPTDIEV